MSFSERSAVLIGIIAVALIVAVTVASLVLQGSMFRGGFQLTADFTDASGLRPGDDVFIAGVRAGTVERIDIVDDHVEVVMSVNGHELPADTRARIVVRTLTGTRGVVLVAQGDYNDQLGDGDRIPVSRTDIPIDAPEFGDVSEELLREVDSAALNELLVSLTDVTRGQREELATLIEGGTRVTEVINEQEEDIRSLLNSLAEVAQVLNASGDDIITIIDEFSSTLRTLRARRAELQRFFRQTNTTAATAADLVGREREELDEILAGIHQVTDALSRHQMDLSEGLAYVGDSIDGFSSIAYSGELKVPWGHVFANSLGPVGIDVLAGCGGLVDQQLDRILGPDPRTCEEQDNATFPDDTDEQKPDRGNRAQLQPTDGGAPDDDDQPAGTPVRPDAAGVDALLRRAVPSGGER
ncbi:MAG TPA: MlaD family protein [Egibacteraceae bacterium]|nr:MlaD family protein [Egibacteraceae bacterium]